MNCKEARKIVEELGDVYTAADTIVKAYRLVNFNNALDLVRDAKRKNARFVVIPRMDFDALETTLHPNLFSDMNLADAGYHDHFLFKGFPFFADDGVIPDVDKLPPRTHNWVEEDGCYKRIPTKTREGQPA